MFKKGQLVRTKDYGFIYIVEEDQRHPGVVSVRTVGGMCGTIGADVLNLIGNNYRAKPKCSR